MVTQTSKPPIVVVLAGPNGAGKTTVAPFLLRDHFQLGEFVNADVIAAGLSGFEPENAAFAAGRIMLGRLRELARERRSFAFETTLASRTFAPMLRTLKDDGYVVKIVFLSLRSSMLAVRRVRRRVVLGGHDVPVEVVRRRYAGGLRNLFTLYEPLADVLEVYDHSSAQGPTLIAEKQGSDSWLVTDHRAWERLIRAAKAG